MEWLMKILIAHNRLKGLSERQLRDLVNTMNDKEGARLLMEHLESGNFKYIHLRGERAQHLIDTLLERVGDLL